MATLASVIQRGTLASRPAATAVAAGTLYFDTTNSIMYRSTGAAWESVEAAGGFTNPMTTQGDVITGGASGAAGRLAIGTAGKVLTVNSGATAPEWATAAGGGSFVGCSAVRTTDQTGIVSGAPTAISFTGTDEFDTDAFHDPSTNASRITIPSGKGGKYVFSSSIIWDTDGTGLRRIQLRKNGATILWTAILPAIGASNYTYNAIASGPIDMAATDYMEVIVLQSSGANRTVSGSVITCRFGCQFLGT